jgi:hypothetical protein
LAVAARRVGARHHHLLSIYGPFLLH